jgi:hypothetical protein
MNEFACVPIKLFTRTDGGAGFGLQVTVANPNPKFNLYKTL